MRMLIAGAVVAAFLAGRYTADPAAARPVVVERASEPVADARTSHCPEVTAVADEVEAVAAPEAPEELDDPDAIDIEQTEAMRLVERMAEIEAALGSQGGLRGRIRDARTGEAMIGVTIVAYGSGETYTSISDESGVYEIAPIPANTYTLTLYYIDATVEYTNVRVTARQLATFDAQLELPTTPEAEVITNFESEDLDPLADPDDVEAEGSPDPGAPAFTD